MGVGKDEAMVESAPPPPAGELRPVRTVADRRTRLATRAAWISTADVMLLVTVLIWALNFTVSKYILTHGLHPLPYSALRYAAASGIFVGITLVRERSLAVQPRDFPLLGFCIVILFLNQLGFVYSLEYTTATTAALIFGTLPIFTILISTLVGLEHLSKRFLGAAAASFGGVVLVAVGSGGGISADVKGDLLAVLGAATWAGYSVAIAPLMRRYSPFRISVVVLSGTTFLLTITGSASGAFAEQDWPGNGYVWLGFVFAVLGPLVLTNVLWFRAIDHVGPSRASLFANLQFFLAALFALVLLSEPISVVQVVGGIAIALGILLSRRPRERAA
jgi:drug/metabolite transporter (DMT)-like permease